jgi:hypothetical protein
MHILRAQQTVWGLAMYDQQRSAALVATLRGAELAAMVIRALRARLLGIPLQERDRESLSGGLSMVEDALRASQADNPEALAAAAFSGDSKSLRQLREVSADVAVDESRLYKLRDVLQKVRDNEVTVSNEDIDKTIWLFARLNSRSLDASRSLHMARRPKKLAASSK